MIKLIKLFTSKVINALNKLDSFLVPTIGVECLTVILANIKMVPYNLFTHIYNIIMFTLYPRLYNFGEIFRRHCLLIAKRKVTPKY